MSMYTWDKVSLPGIFGRLSFLRCLKREYRGTTAAITKNIFQSREILRIVSNAASTGKTASPTPNLMTCFSKEASGSFIKCRTETPSRYKKTMKKSILIITYPLAIDKRCAIYLNSFPFNR